MFNDNYRSLGMPRHYVAAGCDIVSSVGYSLHSFPNVKTIRRKWTSVVKRQRVNWEAAECNIVRDMGYILHPFPKDETIRRKWTSVVNRQQVNWVAFVKRCFVFKAL